MGDIAVKVDGIGKKYLIGHQTAASISDQIKDFMRGGKGRELEEYWALKDVSFEIKKGEAVGIIGKNGAGKSTLLKILSRITHPTTGRFEMNGRVSSLLEVGTGFHPELSGRENVYLNGTILGMTRTEIKSKFDEIVDFSGVGKFLDTPVKHYSSGMYVRLAFSVAAHLEPEILIIDEVLAVGDAEFQKKCLGKMDEVTRQGRTVLFVSHNMNAMRNLCTSGLFFQNGILNEVGDINSLTDSYLSESENKGFQSELLIENISGDNSVTKVAMKNIQNILTNQFKSDDDILIEFELYIPYRNVKNRLLFQITNQDGISIYSDVYYCQSSGDCNEKVKILLTDLKLNQGKYYFNLKFGNPGFKVYNNIKNQIYFEIHGNDSFGDRIDLPQSILTSRFDWKQF